ncbi:hypothetical protein SUGI_0188370 [Cryptomeria japonica]|nr:hypothetical protein SUGI_0188370 [Cryptomeria japonica]
MKSKKLLGLIVPLLKRSPALKHFSLPTKGVLNLRDLERVGTLGSGGIVYKALHCKSSSYYALKVICVDLHDSSLITREMDILRKTDCPYVVKCQDIFHQGGNINFVLEYMDGGSLGDLLRHQTRMSESCLAKVGRQVMEGLGYLHSEGIAHRDIKPSNILTSKNLKRIKIAHFGVSRFV